MEKLSPEQTQALRAGQRKRSRVILILILIWIAAIFALTLVKGKIAVDQREARQQESHAE